MIWRDEQGQATDQHSNVLLASMGQNGLSKGIEKYATPKKRLGVRVPPGAPKCQRLR